MGLKKVIICTTECDIKCHFKEPIESWSSISVDDEFKPISQGVKCAILDKELPGCHSLSQL